MGSMATGAPSNVDQKSNIERDLRVLARFIEFSCRRRHADRPKSPAGPVMAGVAVPGGQVLSLCPDCTKLLAHAFVKRSRCPMNPKPACKDCPSHCYHPEYRRAIRDVMRYSGSRMLVHGWLGHWLTSPLKMLRGLLYRSESGSR